MTLPAFEARYLRIEWQSEGVAREIEVAPAPLELELCADGGFVVESTIFNDVPWLGISLGQKLEKATPVLVAASGEEVPLLQMSDRRSGGTWWLLSHGWDHAGKRHLSELQRSAGRYDVRIGEERLRIENRLSSFGRAEIQAYIDDFRGDLLWMIMGDASGATATGKGAGAGTELAEALGELHAASRRVLASPAVAIREDRAPRPISKVRPTAATFREYARDPAARQLTSRVFIESANIAENRYVRHLLEASLKVAGAFWSAASVRSGFLERIASEECERARRNRAMEQRRVDPGVFERQTDERRRKLDAIANFRSLSSDRGETQSFPIRLEEQYSEPCSFFYRRQSEPKGTPGNEFAYKVIVLPKDFFELVLGAHRICRDLTIRGLPRSERLFSKNEKPYLKLTFASVLEAVPGRDELERRDATKRHLEENNWLVRLTVDELRELRREADVGDWRAEMARKRKDAVGAEIVAVERWRRSLAAVDLAFNRLGIASSPIFPTGMSFVTNPDYAAVLTAFKKVHALLERGGLDLSKLEELSNISILHVSDIYEKWCLLKLFRLLTRDFGFAPELRWEEKLVAAAVARTSNIRFEFSRDDLELKVALTWQAELPTGHRPDFVLEVFFTGRAEAGLADNEDRQSGGIVLDAKFRDAWGVGELRHTLGELVAVKGYDAAVESGRVFVLQPCEATARFETTSPLDWGAHCDYDGTDKHGHLRGWVQTGVTSSGASSTQHLKRLLAMVFQAAFPRPWEEHHEDGTSSWTSRSFCLGCGGRHVPAAITARRTKKDQTYWFLDCKRCRMRTERTHCYDCHRPLFKNGTTWTYHTTIAHQVTNVICPWCESFFDRTST
ncbi:hypothetical protein [Melittangium boletus]|uniref:Uncharacterized protein n=1 Tax=Melittangium boletus DSM 14713 TaxID=1294270 RepID=A0A250IQ58_9BACT|nr:hypothetical protein [Melittangium boletus]ATB33301.1 hypothetical protein MEBOL_006793 [Melittangium boletus DSM 14713]